MNHRDTYKSLAHHLRSHVEGLLMTLAEEHGIEAAHKARRSLRSGVSLYWRKETDHSGRMDVLAELAIAAEEHRGKSGEACGIAREWPSAVLTKETPSEDHDNG